jgi:hypothetical protein
MSSLVTAIEQVSINPGSVAKYVLAFMMAPEGAS